jgi:uncharacterized SAM-binding protein YcdF (DUF218 family)
MRLRSAVVCLGQLLHPNGSLPHSLLSRVETAVAAFKRASDNDTLLIFTGGDVAAVGRSEAQACVDYLRANHEFSQEESFSSGRIRLEERSYSTATNALFCKTLLEKEIKPWCDDYNITLVTSDYHVPRARLLFQCCFGSRARICATSAPSDTSLRRPLILQELNFMQNITAYVREQGLGYPPSEKELFIAMEELQAMLSE